MSALQDLLRDAANKSLMRQGVPSKRSTKIGTRFRRADNEELSRHPGSSRSVVLDRIKAIANERTGCTTAGSDQEKRLGQLGVRSGSIVIVKKHKS